jgi:hypothetical protein
MNNENKGLTCEEANRIDMVDYLASLGYQPAKPPRGHNYWYLSMLPDRYEKTPSFVINRNRNQWRDWGDGTGYSLIDFGIRYHRCTVSEFLKMLSAPATIGQVVSRQPHSINAEPEQKIHIKIEKSLESSRLISYLHNRRISLGVAQRHCKEVEFEFKNKSYYAIGFKNDIGGHELRNEYFKGGSSPKGSTFIDNGTNQVTVFEGFFDFLSFQSIHQFQQLPPTNFLILNSLSFFEKLRPVMERHDQIQLYLDRDSSGMKTTALALDINSKKYVDHSSLYKGYKDINEWHCKIGNPSAPNTIVRSQRHPHL